MKHYNIPIFINHIGCPNNCVFCSQVKINGKESDTTPFEVLEIIEKHLEYLPENATIEVAFFGGTFTGLSMTLQEEFLKVVAPFIKSGRVKGVRVSTRPDCINEEILEQLKKYGVTTIELGVQSLNQKVLDLTERNYKVEVVESSSKLIKDYDFQLGIQVMLGLPGAGKVEDLETAKKVVELKPHIARIYPSLVLSGTEMENMYKRGEYTPYTLEEAVEVGVEVYALFEINGIKIVRVGLQPSEDLREEGVIVAGPFHPAFRDLLEGEIFKRFIEIKLQELDGTLPLEVESHEKNISKIMGNKGINKKRFGKKINVYINNNISQEEFLFNGEKILRGEILKNILK